MFQEPESRLADDGIGAKIILDSTILSGSAAQALVGKTVAVPETRELEVFARLLQDAGATVFRCPLISIVDAPDPTPVEFWLRRLTAGEFQDVIFLTGEGVHRLMAVAQRADIAEAVHSSLRTVRKISRGPKPAKALTELGLRTDLPSAVPTTDGVIQTLSKLDLSGRTAGVQLYGTEPNLPLMNFLERAGATPVPVAPYVYAPQTHTDRVHELIERLAHGTIDVLAFTSASQVKRLVDVALEHKAGACLRDGLARTKVAAIGPVVAEELQRHGFVVHVMPGKSFNLKSLLNVLIEYCR